MLTDLTSPPLNSNIKRETQGQLVLIAKKKKKEKETVDKNLTLMNRIKRIKRFYTLVQLFYRYFE